MFNYFYSYEKPLAIILSTDGLYTSFSNRESFEEYNCLLASQMNDIQFLDITEKYNMTAVFVTHDIDEAIILSEKVYILSGRPGHITNVFEIKTPKPRHRDFALTQEFLEYKREIYSSLKFKSGNT